jgi:hypothetical protein
MSGEGFKFQASVKDSDGDMVNVRADSAEELGAYLSNFPVAEYAQFKANVRGGAALGGIVQPQAPAPQAAPAQPEWSQAPQAAPQQQSQGWGAAQQQAPQQSAPQGGGGGGQFAGPPHPEGKQCQCGQVLEYKKTNSGKGVFRCAQWRWNNGNPTLNHDQDWA